MLDVHITPVTWASHQAALRQIRHAVFVVEQSIPDRLEFDAEDDQATHLLAQNSAGIALGCARLLANGLIGRVAVVAQSRGQGLGKSLMEAVIASAQDQGMSQVELHAQADASGFYQKLGFTHTGAKFMEAGIPHVTMQRILPIPFDTTGLKKSSIVRNDAITSATRPLEQRSSRLLEFAADSAAVEQLHSIVGSARRTLRIYSPTLDHMLFDTETMVELVSSFARSAPGARVEILISDSSLIVARGHLLLELCRRLDGKMVIRRIPEHIKADAQTWLVVDNCALWVQSEPNDYRGWSDTYNLVQAERFSKRYVQLWDRSTTDPELRLLRI